MNMQIQFINLIFWFVLELSRPTVSFSLAENVHSTFQLGFLLALQSFLPLILSIPIGLMIDKIGSSKLLPIGSSLLIGSGLFYYLSQVVIDQYALYIGFILLGQLCSGLAWLFIWISTQSLITIANSSSDSEGQTKKNVNMLALTSSIGVLLGPAIAGWLYAQENGRLVWLLFLLLAAVHLLFSLRIALKTKAANQATPVETMDLEVQQKDKLWFDLGGFVYLFVILTSIVLFFGSEFKSTFLPAYLLQQGIHSEQIGLILTAGAIGIGIVRFLISFNLLKLSPFLSIILSLTMTVCGILLLPFLNSDSYIGFALVSLLLAMSVGIGEPVLIFLIIKYTRLVRRGLGLAGRLTANRAAMLLSPVLTSLAITLFGQTTGIFLIGIVLSVLSIYCLYLFKKYMAQDIFQNSKRSVKL